ncbi:MAG: type II and III secretion system protein [Flavobacteriales bacterium]|nr:type II and III secretion system protein [Flavobacteriales bacterium]
MKKNSLILFLAFLLLGLQSAQAQDRFASIENKLKVMSAEMPGLEEKVDLALNNVSIQDFFQGIAISNKLNIHVDPNLKLFVSTNFNGTTVSDILLFMIKKYELDISFIGNILSIEKYIPPVEIKPVPQVRKIRITYNRENNSLSMDLKNDTLDAVAKTISRESGKNIILAPGIGNRPVNVYLENVPFEKALENFCFANNLISSPSEDGIFLILPQQTNETNKQNISVPGNKKTGNEKENLHMELASGNNLSVTAFNTPVSDIIREASRLLNTNHFFTSEVKGNITLELKDVSYNDLLKHLFNGTDYTYKENNGIYILGERKMEGLRATRVIQLQYRTSEKIIDYIPAELKKDVETKEFPELNSIVASGAELKIMEIEKFLKDVDKVVPVVVIEVIIVDYKSSRVLSAGVKAGLGTAPAETGGKIYPEVDMQLNAQSVNNLINSFNGFGLLNIGHVTPNFYLSLKALEEQGIVRVRSTPKLAAINSHEATMSIGNTEYYLEENNNVIGSQNPQNIITRTYKSVNADLSITIKPYVSGDNQITLDIKVKQSDFTGRISQNAPPGSVSRNFSSMIRVKDQEMVLLGGLEEKKVSNTGSGIPFLSRIPVIKWLFSNRTKQDNKTKLNIFIKPTVLY